MATYGGDTQKNRFKFKGKTLYSIVDVNTGEATFYEDKGVDTLGRDIKLGSIKPGEDFVPHEGTALGALYPDGFSDVFVGDDAKAFLSDAGQKELRKQATETAVRAQEDLGVDPTTARFRSNQLIKTGKMDIDPNASAEEAAAQASQQGLDELTQSFDKVANSDLAQARSGTKKGAGSFGDFSYPIDRNQSQDFMKFTLLEYKPKKILSSSGSGFGFGDRQRVGPGGKPADRTILGSVSLPIPGGIKDENGAEWAPQTMNALEAAGLGLATGAFEGQMGEAAKGTVTSVGNNSDDVNTAIKGIFSGAATGVGKQAMTRTTGMVFNPNLELLFDKPTLRGFTLAFDLVPRSKKEAEECVKIIRFFKQGMSPIRAASNLFLLSPNVFQVHYVLDGDGSKDHPYIGMMKECAMTNFRVDYTPQQNYSTLADGFMTAYKISMDLKELEPVFNDDYEMNGIPADAIGF